MIMAIWNRARAVAAAPSKSRTRRRLMQAQAKVRDPPALRLDDDARIGAFDDPDRARGGRRDAGVLVAGVRKDALEERKAPGDALEDQRRPVAMLHAGGMELDAQHQAQRVGDQVAFAALDPLCDVEADHFAGLRSDLHALAVDDGGRRALIPALQISGPAAETVVDIRPDAACDPGPEVAVDRAARREVPRQHPPLAACLQ